MTAESISLESHEDGTVVPIRVTPRSSRTRIIDIRNGVLRVSVQAPPEKGKANQALVKFLAKRLGLPRSRVLLLTGQTARTKRLLVAGLGVDAVQSRLAPDA